MVRDPVAQALKDNLAAIVRPHGTAVIGWMSAQTSLARAVDVHYVDVRIAGLGIVAVTLEKYLRPIRRPAWMVVIVGVISKPGQHTGIHIHCVNLSHCARVALSLAQLVSCP